MFHWRVVLSAFLALLLLLAGLVALVLPDPYEGEEIYRLDEAHTLHALDLAGMGLLFAGTLAAWGTGTLWQREVYAA